MMDATVDAREAAEVRWDVLVIGAGPAGAAAAIRLARLGMRVLLVDRGRFPRPKVCGCCLSPAAMRELAALDLPAECSPRPVPLAAVWIACAGREARVGTTGGATLSREALDTTLVQAAIRAGAAWLPAVTVTEIEHTNAEAVATIRDAAHATAEVRAGVVVIAAGLADAIRIRRRGVGRAAAIVARPRRTVPASFIGLGVTLRADAGTLPEGQLVMAVGRAGYAGIVRLEDGRIDVAAAVDPAAMAAAGSPAVVLDTILAEVGGMARESAPSHELTTVAIRATPPLTHTTSLTADAACTIVRIGDAAAYVEPFTGEGMGWALASGRVLADTLLANTSPAVFHARFTAAHGRVFAAHHARCRRVAAVVRRPWLFASAVRAAQLAPAVAARAVPWVIGGGRLA